VPDPTWVPEGRIVPAPTGLSPALVPFSKGLRLGPTHSPDSGPATPGGVPPGLGFVPVRSPLLRESRLIFFPPGTEMFQFPGSARAFRARRSLGSSPGLFAAFHARILMTPRHPPRALRSLTTPIGPPRQKTPQPNAAGRFGPGVPTAASADATTGSGPTFSIRKGSVSTDSATSTDLASGEVVKLFCGECHSPSRDRKRAKARSVSRGCV
jgi:hypothetical protein